MEVFTLAILYTAVIVLFIFILLFGENPYLARTPLPWLHSLMTEGPCALIECAVHLCFGRRGDVWLDRAFDRCCNKPNRLLQLSYLAILGGCFALYCESIFRALMIHAPPPGNARVGRHHIFIGSGVALLCLVLFVAACRSDPGTVTRRNAAVHRRLFPYDGELWRRRRCDTCRLCRPARAKHCPICKRCVSRFDHHCGWINNCVGLGNLRIFLAFLLANAVLCAYGAWLGGAAIWGHMAARGVLDRPVFVDWAAGRIWTLRELPARKLLEWLVVFYPTPSAVVAFLGAAFFLLLGFLGHMLLMIARGATQYELSRRKLLLVTAAAAAAAAGASEDGSGGAPSVPPPTSLPSSLHASKAASATSSGTPQKTDASTSVGGTRAPAAEAGERKGKGKRENGDKAKTTVSKAEILYDKGVVANFAQILRPDMALQRAAEQLARERVGLGRGADSQLDSDSAVDPVEG